MKLKNNEMNDMFIALLFEIYDYIEGTRVNIGGNGCIVEIDECFFGKRKSNVGRVPNQKIVLGGICRETKKFFLKIIVHRTKKVLGQAIEDHVSPNTKILGVPKSNFVFLYTV
jgi:hypothetical protein